MTSKAFGLAQLGNAYSDGALSNRNKIINGAMTIDQRNAGASVTPSTLYNTYTLDRWNTIYSVGSKFSVQQNAGSVTPPVGFKNYLGATSLSAYTPSVETFSISQAIEGYNIADLGWGAAGAKTITLSFWVRSSLTGTFGGALQNNGTTRCYAFSYTISAADTWEYKTIVVSGDTSGTWLTTNGNGLTVLFSLGSGATYLGTAGSWAAAAYYGATGQTNLVATSGATFYLTGVQLEAGDTATPFEHRSYGQELALCQRYYEKVTGACWLLTVRSADDIRRNNISFAVTKRASPSIVITSQVLDGASSISGSANVSVANFDPTGHSTSSAPYVTEFTADAEL